MMRVICRSCGDVTEAEPGARCGVCGAAYFAWHAATVPGLSSEIGKYDEQVDRVFAELQGPDIVLLVVINGPKGSGFSVAGEAGRIRDVPAILRSVADNIQKQWDKR